MVVPEVRIQPEHGQYGVIMIRSRGKVAVVLLVIERDQPRRARPCCAIILGTNYCLPIIPVQSNLS